MTTWLEMDGPPGTAGDFGDSKLEHRLFVLGSFAY